MNEKQNEFLRDIMEYSDGAEKRIGDFVIRHDYGANVYYEGKGGDVEIPEEAGYADLSYTFRNAKKITGLTFPGTVKELNSVSFGSKATLQRLVFSEGIEEIRDSSFFTGCKALTDVSLPQSLRYLGAGAFKKSPWYQETVEIVDGCHYLGRFLVDSNAEIERAEVREGKLMICGKAFKDRDSLTEIVIPEGVTTIGEQAFLNCTGLTELRLPESIHLVEKWSFAGCSSLRMIEILGDEAEISEDAFGKETFGGIYYPDWAYIPTEIRGSAEQAKFFAYCYLTSRERFSPEQQERLDAEVKKRKAKLLALIMDRSNMLALRNIVKFAVTNKEIPSLIDKAQSHRNTEMTAFLLNWQNDH